jgi:hypothetical protein
MTLSLASTRIISAAAAATASYYYVWVVGTS